MSALTVRWLPHATDEQFDLAAPLLEKVVRRATKGEFTVDDLRRMAREGRVLVGVALRGDEPVLAAALELVHYPQLTALNVMAMGGHGLSSIEPRFFEEMKAFARACGAQRIEACGSKAMSRLLRTFFCFEPMYEKVGYAL